MSDNLLPKFDGLDAEYDPGFALAYLKDAVNGKYGTSAVRIAEAALMLGTLLLQKNARYGDSALAPTEIFARDLTPRQRMAIRMDDKISRLQKGGNNGDNEDARIDLAGYLLLDYIAAAQEKESRPDPYPATSTDPAWRQDVKREDWWRKGGWATTVHPVTTINHAALRINQ